MKRFFIGTALILIAAVAAGAQGVRYDNQLLSAHGLPVAGANVEVCTISTPATWVASNAYALNTIIQDSNGLFEKATTAGTSGTTQPTWSKVVGATTADNTVTWTNVVCTPAASIWSDRAETVAVTNPTTTSSLGNYGWFASPGSYFVEIYGSGLTTQVYTITLPCDPSATVACAVSAVPTLPTQAANTVFAGPASGAAAAPAFRAPVSADIPAANLAAGGNGGVTGILPQTGGGTGATSLAGANIPVQTGTITTGDCAKWASATAVADTGGTCATQNQANTFTGNNTHSGTETFKNINNIRLVDGVSFTTLAAAISDLPAGGGMVIDPTISAVTVSSDPFAGVVSTKHLHVFLGPTNYNSSVAWNLVDNTWLDGQGVRTSTVTLTANSIYAIQSLNVAPGVQNIHLGNMTIDAGGFAAGGGVHYQRVFQPSVLENIAIQNFGTGDGVLFENFGNTGAVIRNLWVLGNTSGAVSAGDCMVLDSMGEVNLESVWLEFCTNLLTIKNTTGATTVIHGRGVHLEVASATTATNMLNLQATTGTGSIEIDGLTLANNGTVACGISIPAGSLPYKLTGIKFSGSGTYTTGKICVAGTGYNPAVNEIQFLTPAVMVNANGSEVWTGNSTPFDPAAALEVRTTSGNLLRLSDNLGNERFKVSPTGITTVNGNVVTTDIASGTATMTTAAIAAGACGTTVVVAGTGIATTDAISFSLNADPLSNPLGVLTIVDWVTAGNVNFHYCNPTAASVTPTAATLNWKVVR